MNQKKAKLIRAKVYGDRPFRARKYVQMNNGQIHADSRRHEYQVAKGRKKVLDKRLNVI